MSHTAHHRNSYKANAAREASSGKSSGGWRALPTALTEKQTYNNPRKAALVSNPELEVQTLANSVQKPRSEWASAAAVNQTHSGANLAGLDFTAAVADETPIRVYSRTVSLIIPAHNLFNSLPLGSVKLITLYLL